MFGTDVRNRQCLEQCSEPTQLIRALLRLLKHKIVKDAARFQGHLMRPPSLILIFRKEPESEVKNEIQI